ncbi:hypothetical protein BGZ47_001625 [Haplosporangium gracile]|nr:hypothetical protein BGZ47_001625 [Haplosporangium gracile]
MAPNRRSRRLEQKVADAQEEANAITVAAAKKATSTRTKKTPVLKPTLATKAVTTKSAAQPKAKKSITRKTPTIAAAAGTPKRARTTKTTTAKAKGKALATEASGQGSEDIDMGVADADADDKDSPVGDVGALDATPKTERRGKGKAKKIKDDTATADEKKGKTKRTKKVKDDTAIAAGAGENGPKAKVKRTKKTKKEDDGTTASIGGKKRKVDSVDDGIVGDGDEGSGVTSSSRSGPALKKQKTTKGKKSGVAAAAAASAEPAEPIIINKSDPYSVLPTELWQEVMSYLSLSQIANASTVSKVWLEGTRSLQIWRNVCTKVGLGNPKKKYPTHMSMVCSQSYWICEQCLTMNNGKGSDIPLPIEIAELANERQMLCRSCRYQYYKKHPEETKLRKNVTNHCGEYISEHNVRVTKTEARTLFCLRDEDLESLNCLVKRNPHYRNAPPMRLYLEQDVQERSLEIHGGWIGIQAVGQEVAKTRREAAKKRAQGLQMCMVLTPVGEKKNKDKSMSSTKGKMPMTEAAAKAAYEKSIQSWVKALRKPGRKAQLVDAIAEAEGRIAAGMPPLVIESMNPDRKWIDNLRNVFNSNPATREAIKKIILDFELGVYDTPQVSSSTEAVIGTGTGATGTSGAGFSTALPPAKDTASLAA